MSSSAAGKVPSEHKGKTLHVWWPIQSVRDLQPLCTVSAKQKRADSSGAWLLEWGSYSILSPILKLYIALRSSFLLWFFSNHHRARTKSCSEEYRAHTKQPENSHNGEFSLGNHSCKAKTWISKQPFYYKWLNKFHVFQVKFMNWIIMYAELGQILMYWWLHGKCQWTKWSRDVQKMESKTKRKATFLAYLLLVRASRI